MSYWDEIKRWAGEGHGGELLQAPAVGNGITVFQSPCFNRLIGWGQGWLLPLYNLNSDVK